MGRTDRTGSHRSDAVTQDGLPVALNDTSTNHQPLSEDQKVPWGHTGDYQSKSFISKLACLFSHCGPEDHSWPGALHPPASKFFPRQFLIKMHLGCSLLLFV